MSRFVTMKPSRNSDINPCNPITVLNIFREFRPKRYHYLFVTVAGHTWTRDTRQEASTNERKPITLSSG